MIYTTWGEGQIRLIENMKLLKEFDNVDDLVEEYYNNYAKKGEILNLGGDPYDHPARLIYTDGYHYYYVFDYSPIGKSTKVKTPVSDGWEVFEEKQKKAYHEWAKDKWWHREGN